MLLKTQNSFYFSVSIIPSPGNPCSIHLRWSSIKKSPEKSSLIPVQSQWNGNTACSSERSLYILHVKLHILKRPADKRTILHSDENSRIIPRTPWKVLICISKFFWINLILLTVKFNYGEFILPFGTPVPASVWIRKNNFACASRSF